MGKLVSEILSIFQDMASYTPHPIKEAFRTYTRDKSQAELCFLCAIIIVVVVFVIVLPALEAIFLRDDEYAARDGELTTEEEILRYYYLNQREDENERASHLDRYQMCTMRVYAPGKGVVEMSMEEILRECSSSSSSGSSTGSSVCMETIYEEDEEENEDLSSPTPSPPSNLSTELMDDHSRFVDEDLKRRLFHEDVIRPPLSRSSNDVPQ